MSRILLLGLDPETVDYSDCPWKATQSVQERRHVIGDNRPSRQSIR